MNFYNYMRKHYIDEQSPRGDLARDMKMDRERFPKNGVGKFDGWYKIIRNYLVRENACPECLAVFDECWEEYESVERKRLGYSPRSQSTKFSVFNT